MGERPNTAVAMYKLASFEDLLINVLLAANEIQMNCVLQAMDCWNHLNFSYLNLHLSELSKNDIHSYILWCIKWKVLCLV